MSVIRSREVSVTRQGMNLASVLVKTNKHRFLLSRGENFKDAKSRQVRFRRSLDILIGRGRNKYRTSATMAYAC